MPFIVIVGWQTNPPPIFPTCCDAVLSALGRDTTTLGSDDTTSSSARNKGGTALVCVGIICSSFGTMVQGKLSIVVAPYVRVANSQQVISPQSIHRLGLSHDLTVANARHQKIQHFLIWDLMPGMGCMRGVAGSDI